MSSLTDALDAVLDGILQERGRIEREDAAAILGDLRVYAALRAALASSSSRAAAEALLRVDQQMAAEHPEDAGTLLDEDMTTGRSDYAATIVEAMLPPEELP